MGRPIWVDFDGRDLLLSGQLRYQPTSAGTWLKYVIEQSDTGQIPHSVCEGFGCFKGRQATPRSSGTFSEGFDTADLKDAKALLEELAA